MERVAWLAVVLAVAVGCSGGSSTGSPTGPSAPCAVSPETFSVNIGFAAGSGTVAVNAAAGCAWTAVSSSTSLSITSAVPVNGAGTIAFTVAENTAQAARQLTIAVTRTDGSAVGTITVTQAAAPPPIVYNPTATWNAVIGQPFQANLGGATGGSGTFHYQLDTLGGFPPIGLVLAPDGILSGTPTTAGTTTFKSCAVDTTARQVCVSITVTVGPAAGDAAGRWAGVADVTNPCSVGSPVGHYTWNGTISRNGSSYTMTWFDTYFETTQTVTFSAAQASFSFTISDGFDFFVLSGTFAADWQSLAGTVSARIDCVNSVQNATGTWSGRRQ